jgi:pimeloyl-ACP methyl ester carboxylesterase
MMNGNQAPKAAGRSSWVDIGGPVHYLDYGGPAGAPIVVAVHGLGGSALNWAAIAPLLSDRCRVLAPDLAGHGLTKAHGRGTTVSANSRLLDRFIHAVTASPVILMGNSMGGMVSILEAGAAPQAVAGLVLVDAALPFLPALPDPLVAAVFAVYATPGVGRLALSRWRATPVERQVSAILRLCCADVSRVPAHVVEQHVELARRRADFPHVERDFLAAARSVVATAGVARGRSYRRSLASIHVPVLLIHGSDDRLVPVAASRAVASRHPSWSLVVLPGIGHVPQLEAPSETAGAISGWLDGAGWSAARAATHPLADSGGGHHVRADEPA